MPQYKYQVKRVLSGLQNSIMSIRTLEPRKPNTSVVLTASEKQRTMRRIFLKISPQRMRRKKHLMREHLRTFFRNTLCRISGRILKNPP